MTGRAFSTSGGVVVLAAAVSRVGQRRRGRHGERVSPWRFDDGTKVALGGGWRYQVVPLEIGRAPRGGAPPARLRFCWGGTAPGSS